MSQAAQRSFELSERKRLLLRRMLEKKGIHAPPSQRISRRDPDLETLPLSFAQQRLWFLNRLEPESAAYNLAEAVLLEGDLEAPTLAASLSELVRRHEVLRTTFATDGGRPRQIVHEPSPLPLPIVDLSRLADDEQRATARGWATWQLHRPFDLARGPLVRTTLLRLGPRQHALLLSLHHIVADGWSIAIFVREAGLLYSAFSARHPSPLPGLALQYADYAVWQQGWLAGEVLEKQLDYWRGQVADAPWVLDLPTDRPRPPVQSFRGARRMVDWPAPLGDRLKALGQRHEATLFHTVLASLATLLYRWTGQTRILIGNPNANRNRPEVEGLIGCLVNTLVLRADLADEPDFLTLLARIREVALAADAHQDFPVEKLIDALDLERDLSRNALFQVMFSFQNLEMAGVEEEGLRLSPLPFDNHTAQFDLNLYLIEAAGGLGGSLEYAVDLFDESTMHRLLRHFEHLVGSILADPERPVAALSLLAGAERHQLLGEWNDAQVDYGTGGLMPRMIEAQVARTPDAVALIDERLAYSYRDLNRRANQLAHRLRSMGCGPEVRVGLFVERSLEMMVALWGTLKSGAAYLPLDPEYPSDRIAFMLRDAGVRVLLTQETLLDQLPETPARILCLDRDPSLAAGDAEDPAPVVRGDHPAYVIYTSGSTGRPKGVVVPHRGLRNRLLWMQQAFHLDGDDRVLQKTPSSFDVSVWEFFWPFMTGAGLVLARPGGHRDSAYLVRRIAEQRVTVLHFVPSMLQIFLEERELARCASLRLVVCSGEALPLALQSRFFQRLGTELHNLYGPTEASIDVTHWPCKAGDDRWTVPIGHPIANTRIHLLDARARPVPTGVAGELAIGGVGLARGYLARPRLTARSFVPDPIGDAPGARLYRTGDLTRYLPDGAIIYLGRLDHQVKVRGFRIELGEIEAALARHPEIREVVVVSRKLTGSARLVAYLVPRDGDSPATETLRDFLMATLPEHMVPAVFVTLASLPLSANGKVDRRALPEPGPERPDLDGAFVAPRTMIEQALAASWSQVLGVERVGVRDNFFALGGDSILSIQILARMREQGFELSLPELFQNQTIETLAPKVRSAVGDPEELQPAAPFGLLSDDDRALLPAGCVDAYPLAALQSGMIFHSELHPETAIYHDVFSYHLRAHFELPLFVESLRRLIARHPALRTAFDLSTFSEAMQLVVEAIEPPLAVADLRHLPPEVQERQITAWVETEKHHRFNWAHPPLLRFQLHLRGADTFQLSLGLHHSILDGWSVASMFADLFQIYFYLLGKSERPLPPPQVTAHEFIVLERKAQADQASRAYWQDHLSGHIVTTLPRWPRPAASGAMRSVRAHPVAISAGVSDRLRRLAESAEVPLKSVLLAAHLKALSLFTGQSKLVTGLVSNGRPETADGERVLGLFLNTLPLHFHIPAGRWRDLVRTVFAAETELLSHRRFPLAEVQKGRGGPLFEAAFNFIHFHVYQGINEFEELEVLGGRFVEETDFTFLANFSRDTTTSRVQLQLRYDALELGGEQVEAIGRGYVRILRAMADEPQATHATADLLGRAARHQALVAWNDTATAYPLANTLHGWIEARVERAGDAPAVTFEDQTLSYRQLNRRANRLAHSLRRLGVGPETLVGLAVERSLEMVVGLLGILKAGGAYVPIDPSYPAERLGFLIADARIPVLLTQRSRRAQLPEVAARVLALDDDSAFAAASDRDPPPAAGPGNLAYVIYTSGSTGRPKGAMNTHEAICNRLFWMQEALAIDAGDRVLQKTPFSFDVSVWEFFWPLLIGAHMVLARPEGHKDPAYLVELIRRQRISTLHFVPSMLRGFLAEPEAGSCRSLTRVVASGEALPVDLEARFAEHLGARLYNLYGPTEAAIDVTSWLSVPSAQAATVPIGTPIANLRIHLLDRDLQPVPVATPGELYIGGVGLARGYLRRVSLTAERFLPDPVGSEVGARVYRSGDLARHRPDGAVEFLGRTDFQVKIRGFRIELEEVEATLLQHPGVHETVVMAREDLPGHPRLVAYLVAAGSPGPSSAEIRDHLGQSLPEYMVPALFVSLDALPLNTNGKVDRRALPAPDPAAGQRTREYLAPRTPVEVALAEIWRQVLGVERVGTGDNYFELGGDSILSIQISARAREQGFHFSPRVLFEHPTLGELAAAATEAAPGGIQAEQGLVVGPVPLLPVQHWFFEQATVDTHHFNLSLLLEVPEELEVGLLARATEHLLRHHDALRLRFENHGGGWHQSGDASGSPGAFSAIALEPLAAATRPSAVEAAVARLQASLDLTSGPLLRVVYFTFAPGTLGRLFILAHHLVIDGVSWRILLEDLESVYDSLRRGQRIALPAKTTSFKEWSERLVELAGDDALAAELDTWRGVLRPGFASLAPDREARDANTLASARTLSVSLTTKETEALLQQVPQAYSTQINDVLLAALTDAFGQATGVAELLVDLEGHGREEVFEDVDLSRTIGWFTTVFPVRLDLTGITDPGQALMAVKEELRRLPRRGLGYGLLRYLAPATNDLADLESAARVEVLFNYLGQFDQALPAASTWHLAAESSGRSRSPRGRRAYALEVNGVISGNRLQVDWTFSENLHQRPTVERLAEAFLVALRRLIEHCQAPEAGGYTPSDFPEAGIDQEQLELVLGDVAAITGEHRTTHRNAEAVYPLSPQQEGMLFESLAAPGSGVHIEPFTCVLDGELDASAFERAWQQVVNRHAVLRTAFSWQTTDEPLQVVFKRLSVPFQLEDWRHLTPDQQEERLGAVMEGERGRGFEPTRAPLMRVGLFRLADSRYRLLWVHHHILMDGWCRPIVFQEVIAGYRDFCEGREPAMAPSRSYRDYITWIRSARQHLGEAEAFWNQTLSGFTQPNLLGRDAGSLTEGRHARREARLSAAATAALEQVARRNHLTLSTLVQGAWALLLSRYGGDDDVVFGTTISGRPAELEGVESMVGMFIQTLPFRVKVRPEADLWSWLEEVQKRHLDLRRFEYCSAGQVHQWSEMPGSAPLYHSILVYENFPAIDAEEAGSFNLDLGIGGARSDGAVTRHPLTLLVFEQERLALQLVYDGRHLDGPEVEWMARHLVVLLESLAEEEPPPVAGLLERIPSAEIPSFRHLPPVDLATPHEHVAPRTEAERALVEIFSEVLGLERVGLRDNFLELGGHSLLSTQIAGRFLARFHIHLPLRLLYEAADIAGLMLAVIQNRAEEIDVDQLSAMLVRLEQMGEDEVQAALAALPPPYAGAANHQRDDL